MFYLRSTTDETGRYIWKITRDYITSSINEVLSEDRRMTTEVGTTGPREASEELVSRIDSMSRISATDTHGAFFRMYDDDGEHYYSGIIISDLPITEWTEEICGAPLDNFGTPNAGCTRIEYPHHSYLEVG